MEQQARIQYQLPTDLKTDSTTIEAVWKTEILTTKQHFQHTFGVLKIEISITESNGIS